MGNSGFSRNIFNRGLIIEIANKLKNSFIDFEYQQFIIKCSSFKETSGLKERATIITNALVDFLPTDFRTSAHIIQSTFEPVQNNHANWESFLYMPYAMYIERKGCEKEHLELSYNLLKEITKRFTSEFAIRTFLVNFPNSTLKVLHEWAYDQNPNVRRLASEGCRPRLPWAKEIKAFKKNPYPCIELLQILRNDDSKYVQKSVANHMNDISKDNPEIALKVLTQWKKENNPNTNWIVKHALRNELKKGTLEALRIQGYSLLPQIKISTFLFNQKKVKIGDSLKFSFFITNSGENTEKLLINYICFFMKSNGNAAPKTFKIGVKKLKNGESIAIGKTHSFKPLSTRKLYNGKHKIALFVNGKIVGEKSFELNA